MTPAPFSPTTKFNHLLVGIIVALMLALGTGLFWVMRYEPTANHPWRIAITNWPGFDYLYLAEQKGFLKEQNLNIKLVPINSTTDIRTAFERNTIDGYTASIQDIVESIQDTKIPARIVLITDYSNGGDELLVDPSITSLEDLRGKHVGVEITSTIGRYMLERILSHANLTQQDIDLRPFGQTILVDQALRGNLDAIITYEPYASNIREHRPMISLFNSTMIPEEILDVVAVNPDMIAKEPELSRRLQLAWQSALDYAAAHPEDTKQLLARRYGVSPQEYDHMSQDIKIFSRSEMQRFVSLNQLHQIIGKVAQALHPETPISSEEISRTVAVWHQQEVK